MERISYSSKLIRTRECRATDIIIQLKRQGPLTLSRTINGSSVWCYELTDIISKEMNFAYIK